MKRLKPFFAAAAFLVVAPFADLGAYAEDVAIPKQEFKTREEFAKYREAAWAHFRKRCKEEAGEKVYAVSETDGILLMKPRRLASDYELRDQYWSGDPYGYGRYGKSEIGSYLYDINDRNMPTVKRTPRPGFTFVETLDANGGITHHILSDSREVVSRGVNEASARYGVTWDDVSTDEDRRYWIAGGRLRVMELATKRVIAERIGYLIDRGFGSTGGARVPWLHARLHARDTACPSIQINAPMDRLFVEKALKPIGTRNGK